MRLQRTLLLWAIVVFLGPVSHAQGGFAYLTSLPAQRGFAYLTSLPAQRGFAYLTSLPAQHSRGSRLSSQSAAPARKPNVASQEAASPGQGATSPGPFAGFYSGAYFPSNPAGVPASKTPLLLDADGDGKLDIVTTGEQVVCVRLGAGDGTFGGPIVTSLPNVHYLSMAAATDLDGDGFPDLVVGSSLGLVILINQRDGTFAPRSTLAPPQTGLPTSYVALAVGKTRPSGPADVVVFYSVGSDPLGGSYGSYLGGATTYLNDGTGAFPSSVDTSLNVYNANVLGGPVLALADTDDDGTPDLIALEETYAGVKLRVHSGNGDGTFSTRPQLDVAVPDQDTGVETASLSVASLRGDPVRQDVVVDSNAGLFVALNNGDGTFQPLRPAVSGDLIATPPSVYDPALDRRSSGVALPDLNGDGKPDLVAESKDGVASFLGGGDGNFGALGGTAALSGAEDYGFYFFAANQAMSQQVAFGDLNGDGKADLVFGDVDSGFLGVALGNGDGTFQAAPLLGTGSALAAPLRFAALFSADMNGDGIADVLGRNLQDNSLVAALATGKGTFTYKQALPPNVTGTYYIAEHTADFNGDGRQDFVFISSDNTVSIALSNGDGTLQTPKPLPLGPLACPLYSYGSGDVNGDGKLDIVLAYTGDLPSCSPNNTLPPNPIPSGYFVAIGNGDGSFSPNQIHFVPYGSSLVRAALAPYHGVGRPLDLVVANGATSTASPPDEHVDLLTGNGDGTFGAPIVLDTGHRVGELLTDDFNGDGKPDLTVLAYNAQATPVQNGPTITLPGAVLLLAGNGDGSFGAATTLPDPKSAAYGIYTDVNGDGVPDLLVELVNYYEAEFGGVSVLLGNGDGSFRHSGNYPINGFPMLLGNFLGDNAPSIVTGEFGTSTLLMNQGGSSMSLTPSATSAAAGQPLSLTAAVHATLPNRPSPSGTVTFLDGKAQLGSATLDAGGVATFATSLLAPGSHTLSSAYAGDGNLNPNFSATVTVSILAAAPDFALTAPASSLTVSRGGSGTLPLSLATGSLNASVTFACSGLPAGVSCSFAPSTVQLAAGTAVTDQLTISTTRSSAVAVVSGTGSPKPGSKFPWGTGGTTLFAGFLLLGLPFVRPRSRPWLGGTVCAIGSVLAIGGCGGSGSAPSSPGQNGGTPAGPTSIVVTATALSGSITVTHTLPITLNVQ